MITEQLEIIRIFSKEIDRELTINQISKLLKKSYAFTNKYTHELITQEILKKKVIGSAILCSLNYNNEQTTGMLILNSISQKTKFYKKIESKKVTHLEKEMKEIEERNIYTAYLEKSKLIIVCYETENITNKKKSNTTIINKKEFEKSIKKIDPEHIIILKNHENYWRSINQET